MNKFSSSEVHNGVAHSLMEVKISVEEADYWLVSHVNWAAQHSTEESCMASNDVDVIPIILRYVDMVKCKKLLELWMQFGTGEIQQLQAIHILQESFALI